MELKKLFNRLKNGKAVVLFYRNDDNTSYTINLSFQEGVFRAYSYIFDGDDVMDEGNYKDELTIQNPVFDDFIGMLVEKFPELDAILLDSASKTPRHFMNKASKRAAMPQGTNAVLDRRTVYHSNSNLLDIVKPGDTVLDVGCGSGTITAGITDLTGLAGQVTGIDTSDHLIDQARRHFSHIDHISFEIADINTYQPGRKFNVITSARVLQWVNNPQQVVAKMSQLLEPGGRLTILDYNHEKIQWEPEIPQSMQQFYKAFLQWRADAGMDNQIADHLEAIFRQQGLIDISVTDHPETTVNGNPEFETDLDIWVKVAETRGMQLLQDNYITDAVRLAAIADYREWGRTAARSMTLYLKAVTGRKE